jgi:hypothetical protein
MSTFRTGYVGDEDVHKALSSCSRLKSLTFLETPGTEDSGSPFIWGYDKLASLEELELRYFKLMPFDKDGWRALCDWQKLKKLVVCHWRFVTLIEPERAALKHLAIDFMRNPYYGSLSAKHPQEWVADFIAKCNSLEYLCLTNFQHDFSGAIGDRLAPTLQTLILRNIQPDFVCNLQPLAQFSQLSCLDIVLQIDTSWVSTLFDDSNARLLTEVASPQKPSISSPNPFQV